MTQIILLIVLWLRTGIAENFDPTKFDYCTVKCKETTAKHSACNCNKIEGKRTILYGDMGFFRTMMVDLHNGYRNRIANGLEEKEYKFPQAANMHVINYDLELEYIAFCYARRIWDDYDKCRNKHNASNNVGQNIYGTNKNLLSKEIADFYYNASITQWYNEIQNVKDPSIVDSFKTDSSVKISHFTQMIWANVRSIGCAKLSVRKNDKRADWITMFFCNYYGPEEGGGSGNLNEAPIYIKGKPCSKCPEGEKCNSEDGGKWDGLCGKSEPISAQDPFGIDAKDYRDNGTNGNSTNGNSTNGNDNSTVKGKANYMYGNHSFVIGIVMAVLVVQLITINLLN